MPERFAFRRICWPVPDATCLEGGCGHCNQNPYRSVNTIRRYARRAGQVPNRYGGKTKDAMEAFMYGESHEWNLAQHRREAP